MFTCIPEIEIRSIKWDLQCINTFAGLDPRFFFRAFYFCRVEKGDDLRLSKEKVRFIPPPSQHSLHTVGKLRFCILEGVTVFLLTLC